MESSDILSLESEAIVLTLLTREVINKLSWPVCPRLMADISAQNTSSLHQNLAE